MAKRDVNVEDATFDSYFSGVVRGELAAVVQELHPQKTQRGQARIVERLYCQLTFDEFNQIFCATCGI